MLGRAEADRILRHALSRAEAGWTEALLSTKDVRVTRFANSSVHQNVAEQTLELVVRVIEAGRIGMATTSDMSVEGIARAVRRAQQMLVGQPEGPLVPLPPAATAPAWDDCDPRTAVHSPQERADAVRRMCDLAGRTGTVATGAFIVGVYELAIANTGGTRGYYPSTLSDLHIVVRAEESSGYAARVAGTVGEIEPEAVAAEAIEKALRGRDGGELEPGEYEVVLEPYAVADMLKYFGQYAFSADAVAQGTSFLGGRFGEPVLSSAMSIWDDGLDPRGLRQPFDFEGVPKQRVRLVEDGIARGVVHDTATAAREDVASTGHALPPTFTYLRGPFPLNLFMAGGTATHEEVIGSVQRGVWVTRFHYTAVVEPKRLLLTGLTRDGTFLIEGGRVTRPLRNLRFTQDCVEALTNVELLSRTTKLERTKIFRDFFNVSRVPTAKINRFAFTGMAGA